MSAEVSVDRIKEGESPGECAVHVGYSAPTCSDEKTIASLLSLAKSLKIPGINKTNVVEWLKKYFNVEAESELLGIPEVVKFIGSSEVNRVKDERFLVDGPRDSTALLNNFNIDNTLSQWAAAAPKIWGRKFYNLRYQMRDFKNVGTELASLSLAALIKKGYDSFAVVLNTDLSSGPGKHWLCLYMDMKVKGTADDPYTLEFFNSSGNPPFIEILSWIEEAIIEIRTTLRCEASWVKVCPYELQQSDTECGVWCLVYIQMRLEGKPPREILTFNDKNMVKARSRLFRMAK